MNQSSSSFHFKFLTLLFLTNLLQFTASSSSTPNNFTDLDALLAIKSSITSDPHDAITSSWTTNTSFCIWPGVSCSRNSQRVASLHLQELSLQGSISPSIANLTFLLSLDLSNNSLAGVIPDAIALLPRLQYLNLSVNQLTGPIPSQLFNSSSLRSIVLASNQLYGEIEDSLYLPQVRLLSLSYNQIGGTFPLSLRQCRMLETLSLSYNQFTGEIPVELGSLLNLRALYLGSNNLTGTIPRSLGNLTNLQELGLKEANLVGRIPDELGRLNMLKLLNLGQNSLSGTIENSIFNITSIEKIGLSFNRISGSLPVDIGFRLPNLQEIYLANNQFSGEIPSSLSNASMLSVIELSDNPITGSVPETLGDLKFLRVVSLQGNQLKNGLKFLDSLTKCRFLEYLLLGENEFGGELPESIGNLSTSLIRFGAQNCKLKGMIPDSIGNLTGLIYLSLHDNQLSGEVPRSIVGLQKLQVTYLYSNKLQGSVPDEICSLKSLSFLTIYDNSLSGLIPDCIGNMTGLQKLSLADNSLVSTVPSSIWHLRDLIYLNLSLNSLVGSLSSDVGNLKSLGQLDVAVNQLTGTIPSVVGDLQMLKFLVLSENSFSGSIPQSFGRLVNMEGMDLSSNLLTGSIPKSLANLSYFTFLNISFNSLVGEVPSGGVFSNLTTESFMGNKALCSSNLQLGLPICDTQAAAVTDTKSRIRLLNYILPAIALVIVLAVIFIYLILRHKKKPKILQSTEVRSTAKDHRMISYHELIRATENFSESNLLGVGCHGSVYKGRLDDNTIAAIKVLNLETDGALKSFDAECQVMRKVRHRNLVKVISTCSNLDFKALVLQFMPNGSLEMWLHCEGYYLSLAQRVKIMLDVALALEYLHHEHSEVVVHCDLKPSNVLLDEEMTAHVADFGIAKLLAADNKSILQSNAPGTVGYMAPEYGSTGRVSPKADVYSFGILLLEAFTGKRPTDEMFAEVSSLREWVTDAFPHSVLNVVERSLLEREVSGDREEGLQEEKDGSIKSQCLSSIIELGLQCLKESLKERISMKDVTARLGKIKLKLNI